MFQVKAIATQPNLLSPQEFLKAVETGLDLAAEEVRGEFEKTVETWQHRPSFTVTASQPLQRTIQTEDQIYSWVNQGTEGRFIEPATKLALRFTRPFAPKTQANVIGSYGGSRGDRVIYATRVWNPGIFPRSFDETIARAWTNDNTLGRMIQSQIDLAVKP